MKKIFTIVIVLMGILSCSCVKEVDRQNSDVRIIESTTIQEKDTVINDKETYYGKHKNQKYIWEDKTILSVDVRYAKDGEELFRKTKGTVNIRKNKKNGNFILYLTTNDKEFSGKMFSTFIIKQDKIYEKKEKEYLVFQKKGKVFADNAGEEMKIINKKNKIVFNRVNNNIESGFNEYIEFSKGGDILYYRTQYGVGRDFFEINFMYNW